MSAQRNQGEGEVDARMLQAIIDAYYAAALSAGQVARNRAQAAFTITSGIVAVLVAGGLVADVGDWRPLAQGLGATALACWLLAAYAFLRAVASPVSALEEGAAGPTAFVRAVLTQARAERRTIEGRQAWAQRWSAGGLLLTFATVCALLLSQEGDASRRSARVSLDPDAALAVRSVCAGTGSDVVGGIDPARTDEEFVEIRDVVCAGHRRTLRVRATSVSAIALPPR